MASALPCSMTRPPYSTMTSSHKADTVDSGHHTVGRGKLNIQIVDFKQGHRTYLSFGSSASRKPSPMKFMQYSVMESKPAGNNKIQGETSITLAPSEISTPQLVMGS